MDGGEWTVQCSCPPTTRTILSTCRFIRLRAPAAQAALVARRTAPSLAMGRASPVDTDWSRSSVKAEWVSFIEHGTGSSTALTSGRAARREASDAFGAWSQLRKRQRPAKRATSPNARSAAHPDGARAARRATQRGPERPQTCRRRRRRRRCPAPSGRLGRGPGPGARGESSRSRAAAGPRARPAALGHVEKRCRASRARTRQAVRHRRD